MSWLTDLIEQGTTELLTRKGVEVTELKIFKGLDSDFCIWGVIKGAVQCWKVGGNYSNLESISDADLVPPKKRYFHCTNYEDSVGNYDCGNILSDEDIKFSEWEYVQEVTIEPAKE